MSLVESNDSCPQSVIVLLKPYLSEQGYIKSDDDVSKIIKLMNVLKTVSDRCMIINVISLTARFSQNCLKHKDLLKRFLTEGGWIHLSEWFSDSLEAKHTAFLIHLIEALSELPITVELLKQGCIAKSLKTVSQFENKHLQLISKKLLVNWRKFVKEFNESQKKSHIIKPTERATQATSFLDSLTAAVNSNESGRKRKITASSTKDDKLTNQQNPITVSSDDVNVNNSLSENSQVVPIQYNQQLEEDQIIGTSNENELERRKKVQFKDEALEEIFYFEMTEQERLEMHGDHCYMQFDEARDLEKLNEKKALQTAKTLIQIEENETKWTRCITIEDIIDNPKGLGSFEKENQFNREANILPVIYMDKSQIPDFPVLPTECDAHSRSDKELKLVTESLEHRYLTPCIPYWENYSFVRPLPKKPYLGINRGAMRYRPSNFRGRGNYIQNNAYTHHPPLRGAPRLSKPQRTKFDHTHGVIPKLSDKYKNNPERVYTPKYYSANPTTNNISNLEPFIKISTTSYNRDKKPLICRHFLKGKCKLGQTCKFKHDYSIK